MVSTGNDELLKGNAKAFLSVIELNQGVESIVDVEVLGDPVAEVTTSERILRYMGSGFDDDTVIEEMTIGRDWFAKRIHAPASSKKKGKKKKGG